MTRQLRIPLGFRLPASSHTLLSRTILMLAVVALLLTALQPLLTGHLPRGADGLLHLHRLAQLDRAVQGGLLYPRWLPDMAFGFGFPLFNYYAPLSYYLLLPLLALGVSTQIAMQAGYAVALLAIGGGTYLWTRDLFGRPAGMVAAVAAAYGPYILYDVHHRGVLPEVWGLAWLSLTFWSLHRLVSRPGRRPLALTTLFYAALLTSHNILALVGTPLLLGYAAILLWTLRAQAARANQESVAAENETAASSAWRFSLLPLLALLLGLSLTAFFWLPAFAEKELVQIEQLYLPQDLHYGNHFLSLPQLAARPKAADTALINMELTFSLGWPQLLLALLCWLPFGNARPFDEVQRRHRLLLTGALSLMVVMMLPLSRLLWDNVPLLLFVQFPWRFLGPATLFLAVLAGAAVARLPAPSSRWVLLSLAALILFGLPWLFPSRYAPEADPTPVDLIRFEGRTGALGTTSAGDYLPVTVQTVPAPDTLLPAYEAAAPHYLIPRLDTAALPASATIIAAEYGLAEASLQLEATEPFQARFFWFHFPGWNAWLDGRPQPVYADGPHGLLAVDLPAGRHELRLSFGDTPLRRVAWVVSLIALLLFTAVLFRWPLSSGAPTEDPDGGGNQASGDDWLKSAATALLIGLLFFALKTGYLERSSNLFHRIRFDGRQVQGVQLPLELNFGNQMVLIGYDQPASSIPADTPLDLTLYWRALAPLAVDYSVGLHLVNEEGHLYGQADRLHPVGYPTSRWRATEYARDRRLLAAWPGTPPGRYDLLLFVYDPAGNRRLEWLNEVGQPVGVTYRLATVELEPARQPAEPAEVVVTSLVQSLSTAAVYPWALDPPPDAVDTGQAVTFVVYWRAGSEPSLDYLARLRLLDPGGLPVTEVAWTPGGASYPTSRWRAGEIVRDSRTLLIPPAYQNDPARPLATGDYLLLLDLLDGAGRVQVEAVELARLQVVAPARQFEPPPLTVALQAQFGQVATLIGYDLSATNLAPGESVTLNWHWQAGSGDGTSYSTFVHLLGADGRIVAQYDQPPLAGTRPTTGWLPGEYLSDSATLTLPSWTPAGEYRFLLGLYDPAGGRRLLRYEDDQVVGDHVVLPDPLKVHE
jgi:hypothetical protein